MKIIRYASWIQRATSFVDRLRTLPEAYVHKYQIGPTLSARDVQVHLGDLRVPCPSEIQRFVTEGSSCFELSYTYEPTDSGTVRSIQKVFVGGEVVYGGLVLCDASSFRSMQDELQRQASAIDDSGSKIPMSLIRLSAFPFARVGNGDMLGILSKEPSLPIVYLSHESDGVIIVSKSFQDFLFQWKRLCYVDPLELGPLSKEVSSFSNGLQTRYFDGSIQRARLLRRILRVNERQR
jgi:hypothetical protein